MRSALASSSTPDKNRTIPYRNKDKFVLPLTPSFPNSICLFLKNRYDKNIQANDGRDFGKYSLHPYPPEF
jgi:hypothetical protein